jgi:hypothetical protein
VFLEDWLLTIFGLLAMACTGLIVWAAVSGDAGCPKGQQSGVVSWTPQYNPVLKTITVQPVYGCVSNG